MTDHLKMDNIIDRRLIYNITGLKLYETDQFDPSQNSREANKESAASFKKD